MFFYAHISNATLRKHNYVKNIHLHLDVDRFIGGFDFKRGIIYIIRFLALH